MCFMIVSLCVRHAWTGIVFFYPARKEPVLLMSLIMCLNAAVHWLQLYITYLIQVKVLTDWNPFPVVLSVFRFRLQSCAQLAQDQSLTHLVLHLPWWHSWAFILLFLTLNSFLPSLLLGILSCSHSFPSVCCNVLGKNQNKTKTNKKK